MAKILIADDDASMQILMVQTLEMMGHEILSATDGNQALELWKQQHPDLIIADVNMPQVSGLQVVTQLRQMQSEVPVILITADSPPEFSDGFTHFLAKPFTPPGLIARVNGVLYGV